MARLIVRSGYIKAGGTKSADGYLNYIGTRERVEILPDDRPPTRKQEQLIQKLMKDFPSVKNLSEYEAWTEQPTKYHASQLITQALEENWSEVSYVEGYARYIANRPRAERVGDHGLFGDEDFVNLDSAMEELKNHDGNVWTHILSLRREDAAQLGYDHAQSWRDLLRSKRNEIAAAMNIPPDHLRWYAAFHDEGHHPHVHMMVWSSDPKEGFLSEQGLREIKSQMTNEIFRMEMLHLYEDKSQTRDQLAAQARRELSQLARRLSKRIGDGLSLEQKLMELAEQLPERGKISYAQFFLDRRDQLRHPSAMLAVTRLFRFLSQMFQDNAQKQVSPGIHIDRKRRHELLKKREALGIRGPIQEERYGYGQSM